MNSNPTRGLVYSIQHYVIKFVNILRQFGGFHRILRCPPPIKLTAILLRVALSTTTLTLIHSQDMIIYFIVSRIHFVSKLRWIWWIDNNIRHHRLFCFHEIESRLISCNNVAPVTNLCLGRATTRSHSSQWSKTKVAVET